MKLSIVIVNWNVREELSRCLESIYRHPLKATFEILVVDNDSRDGSVEMIKTTFPQVLLVENKENRGFAAACNQGISRATGEYIFFLNPDTEVLPGTLDSLARVLDENEKVAMAAPRILNGDGTLQRSIRRLPTPLSQLFLLLKIHHFASFLSPLKRYFADDFDYEKEQDVEQPMGAALMARKRVLDEMGGFDERFFIWYEEVDLCKRLLDKGYAIRYVPFSQLIHHSGRSFAKRDVVTKQKATYTSATRYLEKHFGWKAWFATAPMRTYTMALGLLLDRKGELISRPVFCVSLLVVFAFELLSFGGYFHPSFQVFGFVLALLLTLGLASIRLEYGLAVAFAELIIGSKGHLFDMVLGGFTLSLREGIFVGIMLVWLARVLARKRPVDFLRSSFKIPLLGVAFVFTYSLALSFLNTTGSRIVFSDANAWIYFLFVFPLYDALKDKKQLRLLLTVSVSALTAQIIKTLTIFYVMGHKGFGFDFLYSFYRWIRTTGVGEVTQMDPHFYRIFLQSQVYVVIAFFVFITYFFFSFKSTKEPIRQFLRTRWYGVLVAVGILSSLLFSFSRSFWLAFGVTGCVWLGLLGIRSFLSLLKTAFVMTLSSLAMSIVLAGIAFFPLPSGDQGFGLEALAKRFQDVGSEAAAASRWGLLPVLVDAVKQNPLGYGFGKEITYVSRDPRVLEVNPSGTYTTYAFEWGYLDLLVKGGVIGFGLMLYFVVSLLVRGWHASRSSIHSEDTFSQWFVPGLWFGLFALLVIHAFTPYLVHPLGIAYLLFSARVFEGYALGNKLVFEAEQKV